MNSTTACIGSIDGGAGGGCSDAALDLGPRNSITFCIDRFPNLKSRGNRPSFPGSFCPG